jgi:hypothetical protein
MSELNFSAPAPPETRGDGVFSPPGKLHARGSPEAPRTSSQESAPKQVGRSEAIRTPWTTRKSRHRGRLFICSDYAPAPFSHWPVMLRLTATTPAGAIYRSLAHSWVQALPKSEV